MFLGVQFLTIRGGGIEYIFECSGSFYGVDRSRVWVQRRQGDGRSQIPKILRVLPWESRKGCCQLSKDFWQSSFIYHGKT